MRFAGDTIFPALVLTVAAELASAKSSSSATTTAYWHVSTIVGCEINSLPRRRRRRHRWYRTTSKERDTFASC